MALGLASVVTAVVLSTGERTDSMPQPADPPGLTTPMLTPASLAQVREFGFRVETGPGYEMGDSWSHESDRQILSVRLADGDDIRTNNPELSVHVFYQGEASELPLPGTGEAVTVNGDPGTYVEESQDEDWWARLTWEYAPDSWAQVTGRGFGAAPRRTARTTSCWWRRLSDPEAASPCASRSVSAPFRRPYRRSRPGTAST